MFSLFMIRNSQKWLQEKTPVVQKRVATIEVSDAGSAQVEAQREQTPPVITIEEFRMMRKEMRELRAENQALKKEMAMEVS